MYSSLAQIKLFSYRVYVSCKISRRLRNFGLFVEAEDREESSLRLGAGKTCNKVAEQFLTIHRA